MKSLSLLFMIPLFSFGCGDCGGGTGPDGGVGPEPGADGGTAEPDAGPNPEPGVDGGIGGGEDAVVTTCAGAPTANPGADVCAVTPGTSGMLIVGDILTPGEVFEGGGVLLDGTGNITCVGCNCAAQATDETQVICPDAVVSPGLINGHDHVGWMNDEPWVAADNGVDPALRWEHRHDWRRGGRGHPRVNHNGGGSSNDEKAWGEMRFVLGGATSIFGSGSAPGLLRNLDGFSGTVSGINQPVAKYETFPLDDAGGTLNASGCNYGSIDGPQNQFDAYVPHVSEGIDAEARNEFLCLTGTGDGSQQTLGANSAVIHGIGLEPPDIALMASSGIKLVWSPRTNISLYGDTAPVTEYDRMGVSIGLGTDWIVSGSMNMLRELKCVDELNTRNFGSYFSDEAIWKMATVGTARAMAMDDAIGTLAPGLAGDIAIFRNDGNRYYRSVIAASVDDVALVLRAGEVLSGNAAVVDAIETGCGEIDVCGTPKRACTEREVNTSLTDLEARISPRYPLFFCGVPDGEPSCLPARVEDTHSGPNAPVYAGQSVEGDRDGDGIADADDDCPGTFNPVRPVDVAFQGTAGLQGDADGDGLGDVCDPCPLDADTTECQVFDVEDRDSDGISNLDDNCPDVANVDQADTDADGRGDPCDPCPEYANPDGAGCLQVVYDVKTDAALQGTTVALEDMVVTSLIRNGFWSQLDPASTAFVGAENSAIFTFTNTAPTVAVGAKLNFSNAIVADFFGQIQLSGATFTEVGNTVDIAPRLLTPTEVTTLVADGGAADFEGLLVEVDDVVVTNATPMAGAGDDATNEFEVTGGLRVDDALYPEGTPFIDPLPAEGEGFASLVGPASFRNGYIKLLPRSSEDILFAAPALAGFDPAAGAFVREGVTGPAIGTPLTLLMQRASADPVTLEVTTDDANVVTVPGSPFTLTGGARSLAIDLVGVAAGTTTLHAKIQGETAEVIVSVRVLGAAEAASVSQVDVGTGTVLQGQNLGATVTLDFPAMTGGQTFDVSLAPGTFATAPVTVTVLEDGLTANFEVAGTTVGTETLTVGDGTTDVTATINVVDIADVSLDVSGYKVAQTTSNRDFTLPTGSMVNTGGYIIIGRNADKAAFETHWGVTLGANVIYINSGDTFPSINGDETFTLSDAAGTVLDGPTVALVSGSNYQRAVPTGAAGDAASWTVSDNATASATPGAGQLVPAASRGLYISEFSDSAGSGNFVYEFVELHFDGPAQ